MKQLQVFRGAFRVLLVVVGTIVVFAGIASVTSLLTNRACAVQAQSVATVEHAPASVHAAQPTARPTVTVPPQAGEKIQHRAIHALSRGGFEDFTVRVSEAAPIITQQEAQQIALDTGYPYALKLEHEGRALTVEAVYGRLTYGAPANTDRLTGPDGKSPVVGACKGWAGPCDIPIQACKAGVCQDTGKKVDRVQGRAYWVLDYGGFQWERQACEGCPKQVYNHVVIVVDAQDKFVLMSSGYTAP